MFKRMKMKGLLLLIAGLLLTHLSFSQTPSKEVIDRQQFWFGYLNQTRLTDKFGTWTDLHLRWTDDFIGRRSSGIARVGLTYYLADQLRFTAGYAYVHHYPAAGLNTAMPEHRPWQQIQWFNKYSRFQTMQYIRLEQRFRRSIFNDELLDGYNYSNRIRYSIMLMIPLIGKEIVPKTPFLAFNDEVHISFGKEVLYNHFDQNRFFLGLGYQFTSHMNMQLGYMNLFQQLPAGNRFNNIHSIRFSIFHNLDFRSRE